jgi:hypothetical protein
MMKSCLTDRSLDALLRLCPDEPLDLHLQASDATPSEYARWCKSANALRAKFPGYQQSHWKREEMKYGNLPCDGAPLKEYVRARISHAKALWSRDVGGKETRLQFREWLPLNLDGKTLTPPLWPDWEGWSEALQILRVACGLTAKKRGGWE